MKNADLSKYGITGVSRFFTILLRNAFRRRDVKPSLEGFEKGQYNRIDASKRDDWRVYRTLSQGQIRRYGQYHQDTMWWTSDAIK